MLRVLLVPTLVFSLALTALAATKQIKLKNGTTLTGEVTATDEGYEVKMKFGVQTVKKEDVASITDLLTAEDEYKERLGKIDKDSAQDRFSLGQWAYQNNLLDEAREQLEEALKIDPNYERAELLLKQVKNKMGGGKTVRPDGGKSGKSDKKGSDSPQPDPVDASEQAKLLLGEADIYRIRIEEARFSPSRMDGKPGNRPDDRLPVVFKNKVVENFIKAMEGKGDFQKAKFADSFRGWPNCEKVSYMLKRLAEAGGDPIKDDIQINANPSFMLDFNRRIYPVLNNYCGASQCHGGDKANGGFKLFNIVTGNSDQVDYTNFIVLVATRGQNGKRLIDRSQHEQSLLLQFMLPDNLAEIKHPKPRPPMVTSKRDPKYQSVLAWTKSLAGSSLPDYRLAWKPPAGLRIDLTPGSGFNLLDDDKTAPKKTSSAKEEDDILPARNP